MKFRTDNNLKPDKVKIGEIDKARNRTNSIDFEGEMVDKTFEL